MTTDAPAKGGEPVFATRAGLEAWLDFAYAFSATAELVGAPSTAQRVLNDIERVKAAHPQFTGGNNGE